jgi:hypothetical protein
MLATAIRLVIVIIPQTILSTLKDVISAYIVLKYLLVHFSKPLIKRFVKYLVRRILYVKIYIIFKIKILCVYVPYLIFFVIVTFLKGLRSLIHKILNQWITLKENLIIINFFIRNSNISEDDLLKFLYKLVLYFKLLFYLFLSILLLSSVISYFSNATTVMYICSLTHISHLDFLFLWKTINATFWLKNINFLVIHVLQVYMIISLILWFFIY